MIIVIEHLPSKMQVMIQTLRVFINSKYTMMKKKKNMPSIRLFNVLEQAEHKSIELKIEDYFKRLINVCVFILIWLVMPMLIGNYRLGFITWIPAAFVLLYLNLNIFQNKSKSQQKHGNTEI
jgi:hypothetical protein